MAKLSKKAKLLATKVDRLKAYSFDNAIALIKECATAKFNESIDVSVQLGVDPKKSDQVVRGAVVLPAGTGKTVRVAVFAQGAKSSIPTISAPAALASSALAPCANTATRTVLPVPAGRTTAPRTT